MTQDGHNKAVALPDRGSGSRLCWLSVCTLIPIMCLTLKMKYRLRSAVVAIKPDQDGFRILTIRAGQTVHVVGQVQRSGMVDVSIEDETLSMFIQDIESRGDPLAGA